MNIDGVKVFNDQSIRVQPLSHFPDQRISDASQRIVNEHLTKYPLEKVIRQKHYVKMVPIASVKYTYRDKDGTFHVYGASDERKVYFNKYPQRCCCACQIQ